MFELERVRDPLTSGVSHEYPNALIMMCSK